MAAHPAQLLGQWKDGGSRAGATEFVAPELVPGTLRAGWEEGQIVDAGLSCAQATNALIDARNAESDRVHLEVLAWSATGTPTSSGNAAPAVRGKASP